MTPVPVSIGSEFCCDTSENGSIFFTPSNTAKQNYMYLQSACNMSVTKDYSHALPIMDSYMLLYTIEGSGELEYMDRRFTVSSGSGFLIDCRQNYSYCCSPTSEKWNYICFNMNGNTFGTYYSQFAAVRKPVFRVDDGSDLLMQIKRLVQIAFQKDSPQAELIAGTLIINILTCLVVKNSEPRENKRAVPKYIDGIMEHINSNYASHITLDALAADFNVSKFHLSREFKKYTGYSPNEYLISVRINRAKELLRRTGYSVGEISQLTGCGDVNHFIQLFKSREKTTPAAYRRHWQENR